MKTLDDFWGERTLAPGKVGLTRLGPVRIWIAKASKEWGFAVEYGDLFSIVDHAQVPPDVVPENLDWKHIAFASTPETFSLRPVMPNRPVVLKPQYPVIIPEGEVAVFYALVPVWLELFVGETKPKHIGTIPSRILSDTWFGNYEQGVLCYSIPFPAERDLDAIEPYPHHVVCTVEVANKHKDPLVFEKLCLRVDYLSLFGNNRQLWSSVVRIKDEGRLWSSDVDYDTEKPAGPEDLKLLAKPRKAPEKGLGRLVFQPSFTSDFKSS